MAAPVRAPHMTLEEFLALPEEKPYLEFVNGEVQAKPMPNINHGLTVAQLVLLLGTYLRESREGRVVTEVRYATMTAVDQRVFLPDINVIPAAELPGMPRTGPVRTHPAFAERPLEDVAPGHRVAGQLDRWWRQRRGLDIEHRAHRSDRPHPAAVSRGLAPGRRRLGATGPSCPAPA